MPAITRKTQKIFGSALVPTGNIAQFGSLAATAPAYSGDLDAIQTAAWLSAWGAALINAPGGLASPALQDMNALFYVLTTQIAYLMQSGMPEWLTGDTYYTNQFCRVGGTVYISKTDNNTGNNPVTDTNNWKTLQSTFGTNKAEARAWVSFDGTTGTIYDSLNIASVNRVAVGAYNLNFTTPMADNKYAWVGSAGSNSSGVYKSGNDSVVLGAWSGRTSVKSVNQLSVFCTLPGSFNPRDPDLVSVQIFGS